MTSADNKTSEEDDKPEISKIVYEDKGTWTVEQEGRWIGQIRGVGASPSGTEKDLI